MVQVCAICTSRLTGFEVTPIGANGFGRCDRRAVRAAWRDRDDEPAVRAVVGGAGQRAADGGDPRPADAPLLGDRDGGGELPAARRTPSSQEPVEGDQGGGSGGGGMTRGEAVGRRWTTGRPRG